MTTPATRDRRVLRRETHSPRSGFAIGIALLLIVASLYLATEVVLQLIGRDPVLLSPTEAVHAAAAPSEVLRRLAIPTGIGVALLGLVLLLAALLPGHRMRHTLSTARLAVVIDDEVIASALARTTAIAAGVAPDAVRVTVGRRSASIHVTPTSGIQLHRARLSEAAVAALDQIALRPSIHPRLFIAAAGRVGA
ncbi:hypothetical protein D6T64_16830 [Cryobacterium melibiosiphilum]|uniref:DUF6286 domain-containing protein n=1 Tax=Cryobacterium melibiosiphilum TaxID=995039 RepID=A0A3A5MD42_9MICO|nr:DUF6286 domain-containing protein [Cryobacterium melibiosiphilum]RJT87095.1 hypothetical protein D6T64_16830 [Cryobacterium melibiosiphilum]